MFFFEKKNQKTFYPFVPGLITRAPRKGMKSLFASFSSEKEDPSLPSALHKEPPP
jgi:hypothetical protein